LFRNAVQLDDKNTLFLFIVFARTKLQRQNQEKLKT